MLEIRVADTGTGNPESYCQRVFDPFFMTKSVGKGTGQGLSIAYNVVIKRHGGVIRFEKEDGKGNTFIVRLPRTRLFHKSKFERDQPFSVRSRKKRLALPRTRSLTAVYLAERCLQTSKASRNLWNSRLSKEAPRIP